MAADPHNMEDLMRCIAGLALIVAGCTCLPQPTVDATPPSASITVEYRTPGGASASLAKNVGDPDVTIDASKDYRITVMYAGSDIQGVKQVNLDYDMHYSTGYSMVSPMLLAISITASCPKQALLDIKKFEPDGHPWQYTFASRAMNWVGAS